MQIGHTEAIELRDELALVCVDPSGAILTTVSLWRADSAFWNNIATPIQMHVASQRVLLGVGNALLCLQ